MIDATEIRTGNILKVDGVICKVLSFEYHGTGRSGRSVHAKLKNLSDGAIREKRWRSEDRVEEIDIARQKMTYLYKDADSYIFMSTQTFEQLSLPAAVVGQQHAFLKENTDIDVEIVEGRAVSIVFPKVAELKVTSAPPPLKGGNETTTKEVELENGLKVWVPQFVSEGETVRIDVDDLTYVDRVTVKSMKRDEKPS